MTAQQFHAAVRPGSRLELAAEARFPESAHYWSEAERDAITLALAAGRPLLVRGEAGSGKSQLARAAAAVMEAELLMEVVHARFEAADIKYRLDLVQRLADAEMGDAAAHERIGDWIRYIDKGIFWRACECSAKRQPVVMLIDEIDKADSDIPNALLDVLGNGSFDCPQLKQTLSVNRACPPLIIITTNEDRELPAAFVRRCVVLNQNPPQQGREQESFCDWLQQRGAAHDYLRISPAVAREAAEQVWRDRSFVVDEGFPPVGLAEYIDLLRALDDLAPRKVKEQRQWLKRLSGYALIKQRELDQRPDRPERS